MRKGYIRFLKFFSLLNASGQERFISYLHYRFHGKDPRLLQWFEAVRDCGSYEQAWEKCFPGKEYRSSVAFQLSEHITKAIESFIAIEALEERPTQKNDLLLRFLIRQKDPELFYSSLKEARKQLETQAFRSEEYFRQRSVHDSLALEASIIRYQDYKARYLQLDKVQLIAAQDTYVAMDVLMLELSREGREDAHPEMASAAHEVLKKYSRQPVAVLLCLLFEYMNRANGISREEALLLCDTWEKTAPLIHPDNRSNYYILVLNVLIKRLNTATREEIKRTLAVYEDIINHPSIPFQRQHYYNLIRLCIRLAEDPDYESDKEFFLKKAHEILEDFKSKLPEHGREDYYLYNRAHIYFAQKNFNALRAQMPEMKAFDLAYESNYRLLWLQGLYELKETDYRFSAQLSSLEQWVARQKWKTDRQKMQHLNAVSFFRKLVNASPGNRDRLIILRNDLADTPDCNRREWLNQKLNEKIAAATRRR